MSEVERQAALGRAVERLVELALGDDALRPGLEALARTILETLERQAVSAGIVLEVAEAIAPLTEAEVVLDLAAEIAAEASGELAVGGSAGVVSDASAGAVSQASAETEPERPVEAPVEPVAPAPRRREHRESEPMDRATFLTLVEGALREIKASDRGGAEALALAAIEPPAPRGSEPDDPDTALPGIVTRARLRAAVARDVAQRVRSGRPLDEDHLHRARSEGAAVWMTDLLHPDPDAVTAFAECLDAVADCCEMVVLLRRYEPADRLGRAEAVKDVAAVQSALRIATRALRETADDDQSSVFAWVNAVTKTERIFVDRHMKVDDPLDPAHLADVMEPVHQGLAGLRQRAERDAALRRSWQKLKYLSGQLRDGRAGARDADKVADAVEALVAGGLPPSSLKFRDVLAPVATRLPSPEGRPAAYGRVIAELDRHFERLGREEAERDLAAAGDVSDDDVIDAIACPSDAVRVAREHLDRIVIPAGALRCIDEIDGAPPSRAWGRSTWRALRALQAYALSSGIHAGFWEWCEHSGHPFAWPASPQRLAMYESETVLNQYREDRMFDVDVQVSPDGMIEMLAHCKIGDGSGRLSPRLYFHDDTRGVTGRVHVGFVGPHAYVRNAGLS